ncbi:inositol 2-dehydrogenase, partial [Burkholderia cenocepacia]
MTRRKEHTMIEFALFGAGRIGKIHAANPARHPGAQLTYVIDRPAPSAEGIAQAQCAKD